MNKKMCFMMLMIPKGYETAQPARAGEQINNRRSLRRSQGGARRLPHDKREFEAGGDRMGQALSGRDDQTIEIRPVQEYSAFPPICIHGRRVSQDAGARPRRIEPGTYGKRRLCAAFATASAQAGPCWRMPTSGEFLRTRTASLLSCPPRSPKSV
jgi:hypothetical protein